jgi:hypothetical protein
VVVVWGGGGGGLVIDYNFVFWTMRFLKVNEKPTNALFIECIGTHSPTCFGTLK